ncbi:hypothetical protein JJQ59_02150 [Cupriavidus necator]|uniref:Uncharacterized protein n=1 Tax=Cupriavidus necator TaxID=106590 RepID=A0A367PMB3_CUPNE|nr:hypothetical protein JJQ59_02150 [Cupriavidus necator]RCJ08938.1 hypothetical protein DDK22_08245 [Cupriavidus necator]
MSERKKAGIIAELERWQNRELGTTLTWERIEAYSGYTRQALSRHPEIVHAYREAKRALADGARPSRSRTHSDELAYLDRTVASLRARICWYEELETQWLQRWQRIAFHCLQRGLSIEDLDVPLDPLNRKG